MKRIGAILLSVVLLLSCAVPAGAYHWSGNSFIEDYYGVSPVFSSSFGDFSVGPFSGFSVQGVPVSSFSRTSSSASSVFVSDSISYPSTVNPVSFEFGSFDAVFSFDSPVKSFSFSGNGRFSYRCSTVYLAGSSVGSFPTEVDVLVDGQVVHSYSTSSGSLAFTYSDSVVSTFVLRFHSGFLSVTPSYALSAPVIKCKKTPRKKCSFVAEEAKKR